MNPRKLEWIFDDGLYALEVLERSVGMRSLSLNDLIEQSYSKLSTLIRERLPAQIYKFWGAEILVNPDNNEYAGGCLLEAYRRFDLPNKEIDKAACFIWS